MTLLPALKRKPAATSTEKENWASSLCNIHIFLFFFLTSNDELSTYTVLCSVCNRTFCQRKQVKQVNEELTAVAVMWWKRLYLSVSIWLPLWMSSTCHRSLHCREIRSGGCSILRNYFLEQYNAPVVECSLWYSWTRLRLRCACTECVTCSHCVQIVC